MKRFILTLALLSTIAFTGCRRDKTHAVSGRVDLPDGDVAALAGSSVEVTSPSDPNLRATGEIQTDGRFILTTLDEGKVLKGVKPGEYQVRIIPNDEDAPNRKKANKAIPKRFQKFESSPWKLNVPASQEVVFQITK